MNAKIKLNQNAPGIQEQWSLLADGVLTESELDILLAQWKEDESLAEDWHVYHVIGDVLRSADLAQAYVTLSSETYMAEFRQRLQQEPVLMAPAPLAQTKSVQKTVSRLHWPHWTGWLAASGFVVMAVVAVVYTSVDDVVDPGAQTIIALPANGATDANVIPVAANVEVASAATNPAAASESADVGTMPAEPDIRLVATPQGDMWRDQRLEPYISAHQQFGSNSVLMPSNGYMRSSAVTNNAAPN